MNLKFKEIIKKYGVPILIIVGIIIILIVVINFENSHRDNFDKEIYLEPYIKMMISDINSSKSIALICDSSTSYIIQECVNMVYYISFLNNKSLGVFFIDKNHDICQGWYSPEKLPINSLKDLNKLSFFDGNISSCENIWNSYNLKIKLYYAPDLNVYINKNTYVYYLPIKKIPEYNFIFGYYFKSNFNIKIDEKKLEKLKDLNLPN